ncbi:GAF domain-containing protein [Niveibacterium sp. SC-1]|uniref:GAF domain-containing protein n=1 Tax=Niveibacterium sp. SC-1 TaxID=3135646 RepID=UPI00311D4BD0
MSTISLENLRPCLEGIIPAQLATVSADGIPNTTYVSQVDYVDARHVAVSFQFFNKTRENILAHPQAEVVVIHPVTAASYRLRLRYLRTETAGKVFERMKARLAGIASHTGMAGIFLLKGADIYEVEGIERIPGKELPDAPAARSLAPALRAATERIAAAQDLDSLFEATLLALRAEFDIAHAMVLMWDAAARKLFTVASHGYAVSGVGSEICLGEGVIGVAAEHLTPIRIPHFTTEFGYGRAIREEALQSELQAQVQQQIPFPGLDKPQCQLAAPITARGRLLGVLYVESPIDSRFNYDHEDILVSLALQLGLSMILLDAGGEPESPVVPVRETAPAGEPITVRHYQTDDSIFVGEDYLIKGVAGAILWRLLRVNQRAGRSDFSNRELRLDTSLRLPDIDDNLEARLILLRRRLEERCNWLALEKTGRGRFSMRLDRPVRLVEVGGEEDTGRPD